MVIVTLIATLIALPCASVLVIAALIATLIVLPCFCCLPCPVPCPWCPLPRPLLEVYLVHRVVTLSLPR